MFLSVNPLSDYESPISQFWDQREGLFPSTLPRLEVMNLPNVDAGF